MNNTLYPEVPELVYACALTSPKPWFGLAGEELFVRSTAIPEARLHEVRLAVRVILRERPTPLMRFTLRPTEIDAEGLMLFRLPAALPRCLVSLRLCLGSGAGEKHHLLIENARRAGCTRHD